MSKMKNTAMKIEDLKNTKIYLDSVSDRVKFKNKLEELGLEWDFGLASDPIRNDTPFFFINIDLDVFAYIRESYKWFCEDRRKQIFLEDILSIKAPKKEYNFKPFDKVLMRSSVTPQWSPTIFACYYDSERYPYMDIARTLYSECVPYEGNEDLIHNPKK